jgi:hypothetical protein
MWAASSCGSRLVAGRIAERVYGSPDGILGGDALTGGRVVIDFRAGEFSISGAR